MAYFRGDTYIWSDDDDSHFWSHNGMDGWNNSAWGCDEDNKLRTGYENASGVAIPEAIVDQFVMMRLAELLVNYAPEHIENLIDDAIAVGNFGSNCLNKSAPALKEAFRALKLEKPNAD